jgi:hypothetical protein
MGTNEEADNYSAQAAMDASFTGEGGVDDDREEDDDDDEDGDRAAASQAQSEAIWKPRAVVKPWLAPKRRDPRSTDANDRGMRQAYV